MLIVPVSGKIGWKNPPVVTLTLLLINCLVFFIFQANDDAAWMAAETFYLESGLAEIEAPYYLDYMQAADQAIDERLEAEPLDDDLLMELHFSMEGDANFLQLLAADRIIAPTDARYDEWSELRHTYEQKRNQCVFFAYGLRPAYPRPSAFITSMFLHGGVGHLVGNMVFLWILGCMLELGSGRLLFTVIYLVSGVMADGLFWIIYPDFTGPLVGASGAIAGLMGAYTVLYGIKRVTIFYSLGFYFGTATLPAIVLLPAWLANECYQLFFLGDSHVAYVAHIGGIVGGALLAFVGEKLVGVDRDSFEAAPEDKLSPLLQNALDHMGNLEMRQAQVLLNQVLDMDPDHREALTHLYNIHKLDAESPTFHETAKRLLGILLRNSADHKAALDIYETYASLVRRPNLPVSAYLQIAGAMAAVGKVDQAEKIMLAILKQKPQTPGLPSSLIKLAQAFRESGRMDQWARSRTVVRTRFPDSAEAAIILRTDPAG
jgi:membrane associated rhomboid family serine protease